LAADGRPLASTSITGRSRDERRALHRDRARRIGVRRRDARSSISARGTAGRLAATFVETRARPRAVIVEPGWLYADGAGFATGRVLSSRDEGDRIVRVVGCRICHLR
jgi:hypothetical protein